MPVIDVTQPTSIAYCCPTKPAQDSLSKPVECENAKKLQLWLVKLTLWQLYIQLIQSVCQASYEEHDQTLVCLDSDMSY